MRHGEGRQSIYYATFVAHSVHIRDEFVNAGITAEHIDGGTPLDEREDALRRFAAKEVRILCNCATFFEGWDCPGVSLVGLARPTKSFGLLCQMVGRGRRPAGDKRDMVILDHAGCYPAHGMPDDHVEWTLDPDKSAHRNKTEAKRKQSGSRISECTQCSALRTGGQACPNCGFLPRPKPDIVIAREGELVELQARREAAEAAKAEVAPARLVRHVPGLRGDARLQARLCLPQAH
jgi:superfamily II DNA or RNA helicase